jgi:hypothetical protein
VLKVAGLFYASLYPVTIIVKVAGLFYASLYPVTIIVKVIVVQLLKL